MGKSSLWVWCGNLILQKDLHHVYLILRNLLYVIGNVALKRIYGRHTRKSASTEKTGRKISQFLT